MEARQLAQSISCFSWNHNWTEIAFSPHNEEVHVCGVSELQPQAYSQVNVLHGHEELVSGVRWNPTSDMLATCSHDCQSFVFTREDGKWHKQMVQTRLSRAALCLEWSRSGKKFAVGSSDASVAVCYYATESKWWASHSIKGKHKSSVVSVAWHPSSWLLATTSTDGCCRVFNAVVSEVDDASAVDALPPDSRFGQLLWKVDPGSGWIHHAVWVDGGAQLAYCTHGATVHFSGGLDFQRPPQKEKMKVDETVELPGLPLKWLLHITDGILVGGGWDGTVMVLQKLSSGKWGLIGDADCLAASEGARPRYQPSWEEASVATRVEMLRAQTTRPSSPFASPSSSSPFLDGAVGGHSKCIVGLAASVTTSEQQPSNSTNGSSSKVVIASGGLDGRLLFWDLPMELPHIDQLCIT